LAVTGFELPERSKCDIRKGVLESIALGREVDGGVRGRPARSNAAEHLGKPGVVGIDVTAGRLNY